MTRFILIAGTAIVLSATPALAGGPGGGGLLGGVTGAVTGGGAQNSVGGLTGGLGDCLCETVNGLLGNAGNVPGHGVQPRLSPDRRLRLCRLVLRRNQRLCQG